MKRLLAPALLAMAIAMPAAAEPRNLTGFDGVNVSDRIEADVMIGPQFSVDVSGPDAGRVQTRLDGDTLRISERNRPWFGGSRRVNATVRVTLPRIEGLAASRGASVRMGRVETDSMSLAAAMGGELTISGSCRNLSVAVSMGGIVKAEDFQCLTADAAASMGGEARIFASQSFDASASMGGVVNVAGDPDHSDVSTSMGGEVSSH
ncbi:GIN domain-containing protein [Terricaulis sp.]|uniref:GIN domain-containing protein n=1 Tax=Terricaulis sp. TaxID=2768686 RepID=UPI003783F3C6